MKNYRFWLLAVSLWLLALAVVPAQTRKTVQKTRSAQSSQKTRNTQKARSTQKSRNTKSTQKKASTPQPTVKGLQSQRQKSQQQIKEQERRLQNNKRDVKKRLENLMILNSEIADKRKAIDTIRRDITTLDGNIVVLDNQLKTLEKELDDRKQKFQSSLRYMHRNRSIQNRLMFIFSAKNFTQMYRRMRFMREYAGYQRVQGEAVKVMKQDVAEAKQELAKTKRQKNDLLYRGVQEQKSLEGKQEEQKQVVSTLQKQQKTIEGIISEQRKKDQALNAQIDKLIAEEVARAKARAEAEARRKAAEEAAKKRAAELARKKAAAEAARRENERRIAEAKAREERAKAEARAAARKSAEEKAAAERVQEQAQSKVLKLTEFVTANDLAVMMNVPVTKIIGTCMSLGMMVSINQRLDAETINIVAEEFGFQTEYVSAKVAEKIAEEEEAYSEEDMEPRAPIVTVMGHVDHGKTSLLDHIRNTNVIAGEAGGITQHIGAYNVKLSESGKHITFLDTPGHEAFTAMRARGAQVTDIAIIIVAADDGVMPQTREAISHAQAAGVPMVFAINKCDKPGANPDKIKEELANMNLLVEDWGGKYQSQDISAKKGTGVHELLDKVLLEAELLDLKANPKRRAKGSIIESSLDKGRGYVATVLVSDGTLHMGDVLLAGTFHGKVKAMFNERGQRIQAAKPGEPAVVLGLNGAPQAGDEFNVLPTEQEAKDIASKREQLQREQSIRTKKHVGLEEIGRRLAIGDFKELNLIIKTDVDGSAEALADSMIKLSTENIQVNVIHKAVGAISDSDVMLAAASDAIIIGFNVRPTGTAKKMAEQEEVDVRTYSIIYDAIEEVKAAMEGMLSPEIKEEVTATVEVLQTFHISKVGTIAGCIVREGKIKRGNKVRVIRDGIVIKTAELASLKHIKDDIKEAGVNTECGLSLKAYDDLKEGDILESFEEVEVAKSL